VLRLVPALEQLTQRLPWLHLHFLVCLVHQRALTLSSVCPNAFVVATTGYPFVLNGENSTSINDATACSSSQVYFNLTTTTNVTLHPGKAYSATHGKNNGYINSSQIWIDFNNSGTFDANETVGGTQIWGTLTNNSPVVIPSTVAPGAYRMRAIVVYNSGSSGSTSYPNYPNIPSCPTTTVQYAEARDYKVTIASPVSVSASSLAFPNVAPGSSSIPPLAVALTATNLVFGHWNVYAGDGSVRIFTFPLMAIRGEPPQLFRIQEAAWAPRIFMFSLPLTLRRQRIRVMWP
jgi:hypothetical protein